MPNNNSSGHEKAAVIGGIFVVIAAIVTGGFLLLNTLIEKGFIISSPKADAPILQVGNPNAGVIQPLPTQPGGSGYNCTATPHTGLQQGDHHFPGSVHVAELWRANGNTPWGVELRRAVVISDLSIVAAGGSVWTYPEGCEQAAQQEVTNNPAAIVITETEMRSAGLIR